MALRTGVKWPEKDKENHYHVVQVAVGMQHALLLTDQGIVYSWGGTNEMGQLGRQCSEELAREACPIVDTIKNEVIVQVACGKEHCLALSQEGKLYSWGGNKAGQLGIGLNMELIRAQKPQEIVKAPVLIDMGGIVVRSCSCGPESSACVTEGGEVYVWGAISYYLFGLGTKFKAKETVDRPVRLRGLKSRWADNVGGDCPDGYCPDQVAVCRDQIACTIAPANMEQDLVNLIQLLKVRSSQLLAATRLRKKQDRDGPAASNNNDGGFQSEDLKDMEVHYREILKGGQASEGLEPRIDHNRRAEEKCRVELQRIGRDLTVCDQQDTALTESANQLESKRSEADKRGANSRLLETQLIDINHFKSSNRRTKLELLAQRDAREQEHMRLTHEHTDLLQEKQQVEAQLNTIRSLTRGDFGSGDSSSIDDALKIATSKRQELAATAPQTLAGVGKFSGLREVLSVSDRALQDVSSALKEVSAVAKGGEGAVLEEVLEANLKLRKDINERIAEKLMRAERGSISAAPVSATARQDRKDTGEGGLNRFFQEAKMLDATRRGGLAPRDKAQGRGSGWWNFG
mmetsp:Transcript_6923/g.17720  ORF Transcript_6923/g.17720 Transcript_6923/m.17720 type:complete len:574 (-) Transcript_6923:125-1846(-)